MRATSTKGRTDSQINRDERNGIAVLSGNFFSRVKSTKAYTPLLPEEDIVNRLDKITVFDPSLYLGLIMTKESLLVVVVRV